MLRGVVRFNLNGPTALQSINADAQVILWLRRASFQVTALAMATALVLAFVMDLAWEVEGYGSIAMLAAFPLALGLVLRLPWKLEPLHHTLSMVGLMLWTAFVSGTVATISTRSPMPVADGWLNAADNLLGLSAPAFIEMASHAPRWVLAFLRLVYEKTWLWLVLTLVFLPIIGRTVQAWRLMLLWTLTSLCVALIAFVAPAYGSFKFVDPAIYARLPDQAGRFAFEAFETFRESPDPLLSISAVGAVICLPSFHTICALLLVQAWVGVRIIWPLALFMAMSTIVATLPIGGHYFVDLLAGALVWSLCTWSVDSQLARSIALPSSSNVLASA